MSDLERAEQGDALDEKAAPEAIDAAEEGAPEAGDTAGDSAPEPGDAVDSRSPEADDAAGASVPGEDDAPAADAADAADAAPTAELHPRSSADPTEPMGDRDHTERRPAVETASDAKEEEAPRLHDVAGTLGGYLRGRIRLLRDIVARHRAAAAALALIAVAAVALLCVALAHSFAVPDDETIAADARARLEAPTYSGGTFGVDTALVTQGVDVRSVSRSQGAPEGTSPQFGASGYAAAEVVVSYAGQAVRADRGATLAYALVDGTWAPLPETADGGVSWHATAGVDQQKVARNAHLLLEWVDKHDGEKGQGLAELYADASVSVESETFDEGEQTDTLEVVCTRSESFSTLTCRLTVVFSFGQTNGQWEISQASADEEARSRDLDALLGTWQGTFQSQETDGGKCLAGRTGGLRVTIGSASATDGSGTISGTVSGVAHYHANPGADARASEGDAAFADVPFTGSLASDKDGRLVFEATLPEDVGGTVSLTLRFGTKQDPKRVEAQVTTEFPHTETIFIFPHEVTATYEDTFALTKL